MTRYKLTKYELTRYVGLRAQQIKDFSTLESKPSTENVKSISGIYELDMAYHELGTNNTRCILKRNLPNNLYKRIHLNETKIK
jgi:DNA-directed RNA polymerase subunit K/omega